MRGGGMPSALHFRVTLVFTFTAFSGDSRTVTLGTAEKKD